MTGIEEALLAYETNAITLHSAIRMPGGLTTTLGRLIFNEALKGRVGYVNETVTSKKLKKIIEKVLDTHGMEIAREALDDVKLLGFEMATISGITWAMADLIIPKEKSEIVRKADNEVNLIQEQYREGLLTPAERKARVISVWDKAKTDLAKLVA